MKYLFLIFISLFTLSVSGQPYSFSKNFISGKIILKNLTPVTGLIKWMPDQTTRLRFTKNFNGSADKYAPEDLYGFEADSLKFVSLFKFEVYAESYEFLGNTTKIKSTFGQLLDSGHFSIYLVITSGYNRSGDLQYYTNYLFQKKAEGGYQYAAYPVGLIASDKKYDHVKEGLLVFFKDYPEILEKIKPYKQTDDFADMIEWMKTRN